MSGLPEWPLLIALAIGLLIGMDRERRKGEEGDRHPAGLRTFALVALLGATTAMIGDSRLVVLAGAFVALATLAGYVMGDRKDPGLTGEAALVLTFVLGVLAWSRPALAFEIGVVVAALLAFRVQLHRLVRERISERELLDLLTFAIAAAVILPVLPNRAIDPFGLLNPFTLWRLAVVAMGLSALGYAAQRLVGARFGLLVAGLVAGLLSSTVAFAAMGARARAEPALARSGAAGAVASMIGSLAYLAALVGAVSLEVLRLLAPSLGLAVVLLLAYAAWLVRGAPKTPDDALPQGRAFNWTGVFLFVILVGGFSLAADGLNRWLGVTGALIGATVMGLADAHAASVSMAALNAGGQLTTPAAATAILLTLTTNMAVKIPTAFLAGGRDYGLRASVGVVLVLVAIWAAWGAAWLARA